MCKWNGVQQTVLYHIVLSQQTWTRASASNWLDLDSKSSLIWFYNPIKNMEHYCDHGFRIALWLLIITRINDAPGCMAVNRFKLKKHLATVWFHAPTVREGKADDRLLSHWIPLTIEYYTTFSLKSEVHFSSLAYNNLCLWCLSTPVYVYYWREGRCGLQPYSQLCVRNESLWDV